MGEKANALEGGVLLAIDNATMTARAYGLGV